MLVSELIISLQREASETQNDTGFNALYLSWVQDALNDFANETDWRFFQSVNPFNTIASTAIYNLPATHKDVRSIVGPSPTIRKLDYMAIQDLQARQIDILQTGTPSHYYYVKGLYLSADSPYDSLGLQIGLWPIPVAVESFTAYTMVSPNQLAVDDVVPVFDNHITTLKHRVRYYIAADEKDTDLMQIHNQAFQQELQRIARNERTKRDNNRRMQVTDIEGRSRKFVQLDPNHFHN